MQETKTVHVSEPHATVLCSLICAQGQFPGNQDETELQLRAFLTFILDEYL
jgi:hypothetical protein